MDRNLQVMLLLAMAAFSVLGLFLLMPVGNASPVYAQSKPDTKQLNVSASPIDDNSADGKLRIVSREDWGARSPKGIEDMENPVPFVIIHHSAIPAACYSEDDCAGAMRTMQKMHQDTNGWDDIGYSFGIGGDNRIYVGRGWSREGAHAPTYNNRSVGICLIGDWSNDLPPPEMMEEAHRLIAFGVRKRYIAEGYALFGHRQVRAGTECPGEVFYNEMTTWPQWGEHPPHKYYPPVMRNASQSAEELH